MMIFLLILGCFLLYLGAESLVRGGSRLALSLGISPLVVGLTIVSMSTSLPEAVASLTAQLKEGSGDIALANVIGSNIANVALILGLTALIHPLSVSPLIKTHDTPIMITTLILLLLFMIPGTIGRISGLFLILLLIVYVVHRIQINEPNIVEEEMHEELLPKAKPWYKECGIDLALIALGVAFLIGGGYAFIKGAVALAKQLGISERVIGLTIVAIGTSLPELATSLVAAFRKHYDIAVGNIVGSNIFNSLFIVGLVALISPIHFSYNLLLIDGPVMLLFSIALFLIMLGRETISRLSGFFLLLGYAIYLVYLI